MNYLLTSDWHLTPFVPKCRIETQNEWIELQIQKIQKITDIATQFDAHVCVAGDIFDRCNPPIWFINRISSILQRFINLNKDLFIFGCAGNHDLPYHNINELYSSGFGILLNHSVFCKPENVILDNATDIYIKHFSNKPAKIDEDSGIFIDHRLVFEEKIPPFVDAITAKELSNLYPNAKLIVCGDNHHGFLTKINNTIIVVPGCITIQSASEIDYTPKVYVYNSEKNKIIDIVELPDNLNNIKIDYLKEEKQRNDRIDNFVELLKNKQEITFNFLENLEKKLKLDIPESVKKIIIDLKTEVLNDIR